jgi:L-aspartate oxidase
VPSVVIIGSGVAGLVAALRADAAGYVVTLVTKTELAESNTRYAQGGIAAAVFDDDSVAAHIEDTMVSGAGLSARAAVEVLCTEGPARIRDLIAWGVAFDRSGDSFARGLEAAHSSARVLHAGGDSTGAAIEWALVDAVRASGVRVIEHAFATSLLLDDDRVTGVELLPVPELAYPEEAALRPSRRVEGSKVEADAIVLTTGGGGHLYPHTTNPSVATGDGVALALRAGAVLRDLEFFQFHPTALALPGNFLVSEAVRGEGAVLLNEHGQRFMTVVHPAAELAPRDVVARAIAREMALQEGVPVRLDATALDAELLASRFPTIDAATRGAGLDWAREPIPVTPAAHYWMGGVATDLHGRTSLPGLFAVGEVANTGVHGANRLASNSLLEAVVFGWRVVDALDSVAEPASVAEPVEAPFDPSRRPQSGLLRAGTLSEHTATGAVEATRTDIQSLLWNAAGLQRDGDTLDAAAETLATWNVEAASTVREHEDANLLDLARSLVEAASARRESRGAHYRSDFPNPSEKFAHQLSWARKAQIHAHR